MKKGQITYLIDLPSPQNSLIMVSRAYTKKKIKAKRNVVLEHVGNYVN